jgi:CMP-N,N'-diacetyllegionaminic acid synthase
VTVQPESVLSTVAFIPARGGSKGVPRKNLAVIGGVSLVGRAVQLADRIPTIDEVVVSSDDEEILQEARAHGATIERRSPTLARDDTPTLDVLRDYLDRHPAVDVIVLLQPTSPLRAAADVTASLDRLAEADSVVTVTALEHPPEWTFDVGEDGRLEPLNGWDAVVGRRQDAPKRFRLNGAVYVVKADNLRSGGRLVDRQTVAVVMPGERSVDIDTELDLAVARLLLERQDAGLLGTAAGDEAPS